jgi:hypothetical protein
MRRWKRAAIGLAAVALAAVGRVVSHAVHFVMFGIDNAYARFRRV